MDTNLSGDLLIVSLLWALCVVLYYFAGKKHGYAAGYEKGVAHGHKHGYAAGLHSGRIASIQQACVERVSVAPVDLVEQLGR
jgi:hypothetical protein